MAEVHHARTQARHAVAAATQDAARRGDHDGARRKAQSQLDIRLATAPRASHEAVACARGCAMCCHLRVAAMPAEVFGVLAYLRRQLTAAALTATAARIRDTAQRLHALRREALLTVNVACPLLDSAGACTAYPARPFNCRAYHSLDVRACEESFEDPSNLALGHPQSALLGAIHAGAQEGLRDSLRAGGADITQYELVTALAEVLDDPDCERRHAAGESPFRRAIRL